MMIVMKELFQTIDAMDAHGFAAAFTREGLFRFGNAPTVVGREAIENAVDGFLSQLTSLRHHIFDVWDQEEVVISEVGVTYTRVDGKVISLPAATIGRRNNGLFSDYRIYMDVNPLFE